MKDHILDLNQSAEELATLHIYPRNDIRLHVLSKKCWCRPIFEIDDFGNGYYEHYSADGREDYQTGKRKVH